MQLRRLLPLMAVLISFLWTSIYGLNFGMHWDENRAKFDSVKETLRTGLFFQEAALTDEGASYNHGGVNYILTWIGFTPEILSFLYNGPRTRESFAQYITPIVDSTAVRIRVRAIYVVLSSLSIVWLFYLVIVLGRSRLEAFWAAAILSCSWEIAYHSRWNAPDVIMMQFALLSFLCLAVGMKSKRLDAFYVGAIAIGMTIGSKYTGSLVLPFFLAGAGYGLWLMRRSVPYVLKHCLSFTAITILTFVMTTPGAVIDPFRFFRQLQEQQEIYAMGWYGYSVEPGIHHLAAILKYFSIQVFSHYWSISIVLAIFCLVGLVSLILERQLFSLLALGFSIVSVAFFSEQAAMIVRNVLVVVPFLALAAARGITTIAERFTIKKPLYAFIGVLLAVNCGWQVYAARQIKIRFHPEYFLSAFEKYVQTSSNDTFFVSAKLEKAFFDPKMRSMSPNVVTDPALPHTKVAFFQTEGPDRRRETWPSNIWGMYEKVFGPLEVNLEAYSTFGGNERIIVVTRENFGKLPLAETELSMLTGR
jgi:4-amino-4-deoxy-L-arabinose transferase-like glycosyltransferase